MDVGLVCDACSALTPIGVPQCARCGEPVALDPRRRPSGAPPLKKPGTAPPPVPAGVAGQPCPKCATTIPPNFRFCPNCGHRVQQQPQTFDVETRVGPRIQPAAQAE